MPIPGVDTLAISVLLDTVSNDGTFPYDISAYVRLPDNINIGRGRGDEFTDVQPSTCSLTLENIDGRFTLGSTSGGYGAINIDRRIRVEYTINGVTTKRFTGYVQSWPVEWPDGSDVFAVARITAVDRLARLSRRELRSVIEQEILLDGPAAYYTLGEAAGATSAGDTSGNQATTLATAGSGAAVVFGNATGPGTDGLTAAQFAGGKYLRRPSQSLGSLSNLWVEVFFSTTSGSDGTMVDLNGGNLVVDSLGRIDALGFGIPSGDLLSGTGYNDGQVHHALVTVASGGSIVLYVDGTSVNTDAGPGDLGSINGLAVGAFAAYTAGDGDLRFNGALAHVAIGTSAISAARVAAHANAGLNGFNTDRSDQRIARYASYGGIAATDMVLETGVATNVPHLDIAGMSVLSAMAKVMQAEGGLLFIRGDGKLVMQNRNHRALQTTPDLTLTTNDISPDSKMSSDMQLVRNYVTASAGQNGAVQTAKNQASIDAHEQYPDDLSGLLVNTDQQALDAANWRVSVNAEPAARMPSLSLDLLTLTAAQAASVQALELSDRVQITGLPSQALNGTTTADLIVEGWTETLSADSWDMTFNTSNFSQASAWVLDDSTYSVLGTTTRLSY